MFLTRKRKYKLTCYNSELIQNKLYEENFYNKLFKLVMKEIICPFFILFIYEYKGLN